MKKRPPKFVDLAPNARHDYMHFSSTFFKTKNPLSGAPKYSRNVLSKLILIGLFVFNNNWTMGEPKRLQTERVGKTIFAFIVRPKRLL